MLKIGVAIAIPLAIGFMAFPSMRATILSVAPFAVFLLCPLSMLFMGGMMGGNKNSNECSQCGHHDHQKEAHDKAVLDK
jgi:hypothetical protein